MHVFYGTTGQFFVHLRGYYRTRLIDDFAAVQLVVYQLKDYFSKIRNSHEQEHVVITSYRRNCTHTLNNGYSKCEVESEKG